MGALVVALAAAVLSSTAPGLTGAGVTGFTGAASAQTTGADIPTTGRFFDPVFDEVEVTEDIVYGRAEHVDGVVRDMHLDLYEPAGDTAAERPVIVLLHGGYLVIGDHKSDAYGAGPGVARIFVEMGYVVASVQYRLRPDMGYFPDVDQAELEAAGLDAYDDVAAAIGWLRDNAAEHRIDPEAIVPFGFSAGGAIAWGLAWTPGSPVRPDAIEVPAAVSVAGAPFETSQITGEDFATPTPGDAPVLAYHGDADTVVAYELAAEPCGRAASVGVRCDLVTFEGVGHPAIDPAFVPALSARVSTTTRFLAEVVLAPLGHLDAGPPTTPTTTPPPSTSTPPATPGSDDDQASARPVAQPARPVVGDPTYTG